MEFSKHSTAHRKGSNYYALQYHELLCIHGNINITVQCNKNINLFNVYESYHTWFLTQIDV